MAEKTLEELYSQVQAEFNKPTDDTLEKLWGDVQLEQAADSSLSQSAVQEEIQSNVNSRPDLIKRGLYNMDPKNMDTSLIGGALQPAVALAQMVGGVGQHTVNAIINNSQMGDELRGSGVDIDKPGQFTSMEDISRLGGAGPMTSSALGLVAESFMDPTTIVGGPMVKGTRELVTGAGNAARSAAVTGGLKLGGIRNAEQIAQLHADRFIHSNPKVLQRNNAAAAEIATEIHGRLNQGTKIKDAAYAAFEDNADKVMHAGGDVQTLGQSLRATKNLGPKEVRDKVLNTKVDTVHEIAAPTTTTQNTKRSSVVNMTKYKKMKTPSGEEVVVPIKTRTEGEVISNPAIKEGFETKSYVDTGDLIHEKESVTTTTKSGSKAGKKPSAKPVTVADMFAKMESGKPMSSAELYNLEQTLKKSFTYQTPESVVAGKLHSQITDFLRTKDPKYAAAHRANTLLSDAREAAKELYGEAQVNSTGLSFTDPSKMMSYFDTAAESTARRAPQTVEATLDALTGGRSMLTARIKSLAANKGLFDDYIKLTAASVGGSLSVAAAHMGVPAPVLGALMAGTVAASSPRATTALARTLYGNARWQKELGRSVEKYINSPAGQFLKNSGAVDAMKVTAENTARAVMIRQLTGRGVITPPVEEEQEQNQF